MTTEMDIARGAWLRTKVNDVPRSLLVGHVVHLAKEPAEPGAQT